jgi:hypothetical protein
MQKSNSLIRGVLLMGLIVASSGCVVATPDHRGYHENYREGYYDRDHHRYWHERAWHDCVERDEHCR